MAASEPLDLLAPLYMHPGALDRVGARLAAHGVTGAVVITNEVVGPLYATRVSAALGAAGVAHTVVTLPDGEQHKNLDTVRALYERFIAAGLDRGGVVIALGGGVIGDTAGFAAATYLRGVGLVQAPTTLLAMIDASIGGKTGVDLPQGKNLVGAFARPLFIAADVDALATLPPIEVRNGLAEMVKAAIIGDAALFAELEGGGDPLALERIERAAAVKLAIVGEDPYERGRRSLLNLGHTFAHALERVSGYTLPHGQAVAIGLVLAARLAHAVGLCSGELPERVARLLARLGLPVETALAPDAVLAAMGTDKKRRGGTLRFVLPRDVGDVVLLENVSAEALRSTLDG